jgi:hypothetical protein
VKSPLTSEPRGWPAGQLLCQFGPKLHGHVSTQEGEGQGGKESYWRLNSLAVRACGLAASHHLVSYHLSQVGGAP